MLSQPSRLIALPDELILNILYWLFEAKYSPYPSFTPARKFDLYGFARTCRRAYGLARDCIFTVADSRMPNLPKFMEDLVEDDHLRSRVKEIRWEYYDSSPEFFDWPSNRGYLVKASSTALLPILQERLRGIKALDISSDTIIPLNGHPPNLLAAMLSLTPNIRAITVTDRYEPGYWPKKFIEPEDSRELKDSGIPLWIRLVCESFFSDKDSFPQPARFASIQKIDLSIGFLDLSAIDGLLHLPNLKTVILQHIVCEKKIPIGPWKFPDRGSNVVHLELQDCKLDIAVVHSILRKFKALTTFKYWVSDAPRDPEFTRTISRLHYATILKELLHHKDTLETLKIGETFPDEPEAPGSSENDQMRYTDKSVWLRLLREFTNVKTLAVPFRIFTNAYCYILRNHGPKAKELSSVEMSPYLPPHVELFELSLDNGDSSLWQDSIRELAKTCQRDLPNLKKVFVGYDQETIGFRYLLECTDEDEEEMQEMFKEVGVELEMDVDIEEEDEDAMDLWGHGCIGDEGFGPADLSYTLPQDE